MTINETKVVLELITVYGKTMREHLDFFNQPVAISYIEYEHRKSLIKKFLRHES